MIITHNMPAIGTQRILNKTSISKSKSSEKLSSGYKINRAADNAAGMQPNFAAIIAIKTKETENLIAGVM